MSEPIAYLNGQFVPAAHAVVPVNDAGFMLGTTVAEQLRTFGGRLFRLDAHLDRLMHSLEIVGVRLPLDRAELVNVATEVARRNHQLLDPGDDVGLTIFVTPGPYVRLAGSDTPQPILCLHATPIPFHLWATKYARGDALATTDVAQVPSRCWPPELKCRSRMHYYLADRQARERYAGARAIMVDDDGMVTEATTANLLVYREGVGLLTPPHAKVLPGISLATARELIAKLDIPLVERDIAPEYLAASDEVLLTSTSPCILPVTSFNGAPVGSGAPGSIFRRLLAAWSDMVGLDIEAQANRFAHRDDASR